MAYTNISMERFNHIRCKYFVAKTHSLIRAYFSFWAFCITDCYTAAFLSPVLESKQSIINCGGNIISVKIVNTENAAFLPHFISSDIKVHLILVHWSFLSAFAFYVSGYCQEYILH